ncbi:MAG: ABC transporter permease [candidate division NC10 bacterium]|nr:ABC transporter permease [candidate division NC10 bacterium]
MKAKKGKSGQFSLIWASLRRNRLALFGGWTVVLFLAVALLAPQLAPKDPYRQDLASSLQSPNLTYPLGTDEFGRDILSRIIFGARISLLIGVVGVSLSLLAGIVFGMVAGFFGGIWDSLIMRAMDILLSFPSILLAIAIVSALGPGLVNVMFSVGVISVPIFARIIRGSVLSLKEREFVEAARSLGASHYRIILRHLLPNCFGPVIVLSSLRVATVIITASGLSFLGLGAQPPTPEWGAMLSHGRTYLRAAPWVATFPGLAIMVVVFGFNLLGDGLRDALDPYLRE